MDADVARTLLEAVERESRAESSARDRRVAAIRAAVGAGIPITHIARSAGLSRKHVYRLLED